MAVTVQSVEALRLTMVENPFQSLLYKFAFTTRLHRAVSVCNPVVLSDGTAWHVRDDPHAGVNTQASGAADGLLVSLLRTRPVGMT